MAAGAGEAFTVVLQDLKLCLVFFELFVKTALLQSQIVEIFAVSAEDERFDHGRAGWRVGFEYAFASQFDAAERVYASFESRDAEETPFGVGDGLDEEFFFVVFGLELLFDESDEVLVGGNIVRWQEDGWCDR